MALFHGLAWPSRSTRWAGGSFDAVRRQAGRGIKGVGIYSSVTLSYGVGTFSLLPCSPDFVGLGNPGMSSRFRCSGSPWSRNRMPGIIKMLIIAKCSLDEKWDFLPLLFADPLKSVIRTYSFSRMILRISGATAKEHSNQNSSISNLKCKRFSNKPGTQILQSSLISVIK